MGDPKNLNICVIHCGRNNIDKDTPTSITYGIILIASAVMIAKPNVKIIITGLLPRDLHPAGYRRHKMCTVSE